MAKVRVFHDPVGNTLVVWFGEPEEEYEVEETGDEVVLTFLCESPQSQLLADWGWIAPI